MKKVLMVCITAALMMAPLAARTSRVVVAPAFGWGGYAPYSYKSPAVFA
jgi:hypothetical protein